MINWEDVREQAEAAGGQFYQLGAYPFKVWIPDGENFKQNSYYSEEQCPINAGHFECVILDMPDENYMEGLLSAYINRRICTVNGQEVTVGDAVFDIDMDGSEEITTNYFFPLAEGKYLMISVTEFDYNYEDGTCISIKDDPEHILRENSVISSVQPVE